MHFLTILDIEVDLIRLLSPVVRPLVDISEVLSYFRLNYLLILECLSFTQLIFPLHLSDYRVVPFNL